MSEQQPFVITISRLLGAGGSYVGQRVASRLGIAYADREIVREAARALQLPEEVGETLDEKCTPFWQSLLRTFEYGSMESGFSPPSDPFPTDREFHEAESQVVRSIADSKSAVIVGRGGFFLLRDRKRHLSVFLHADRDFRVRRIQEVYDVSPSQAEDLIDESDRNRYHYLRNLTHTNMTDALQFHLCLDTSALGLSCAEQVIIESLQARIRKSAE